MNPALEAVVRAAVDATGAAAGCAFAEQGEDLVVAAVAGDVTPALLGRTIAPGTTSAGFVVSSGQPIARSVRPDEATSSTLAVLLDRHPASILSVPCTSDHDVVGALELLDKAGATFTIDDIELVTLLAGIAGPALAYADAASPALPDPSQLSAELTRLADVDPVRYSAVARVLAVLLELG